MFNTDEWKEGDRVLYGGAIIGQEEIDAVLQTITEGNGRNWGIAKHGAEFEAKLAEYSGHTYCVLANSGSSALLLAIHALNLPRGSRIAIPAACFPTAFGAIVQAGMVPVIVDADPATLNISVESLREVCKNGDIAAVVVVAIVGNVPDMHAIKEAAGSAKIVFDNCDGFGGTYDGRPVESYADVAVTSFHAAHIITTGEGGAVFTSDFNAMQTARKYRDWGRSDSSDEATDNDRLPAEYPKRYAYDVLGYNLKMLDLQAAMGVVQLGRLPMLKAVRRSNHNFLTLAFAKYPELFDLINEVEHADPCWFSCPVLVKGGRQDFVRFMESKNIETRPVFAGNIAKQKCADGVQMETPVDLSGSDRIANEGVFVGVAPRYDTEVFEYVARCIDEYAQSKS